MSSKDIDVQRVMYSKSDNRDHDDVTLLKL